MTCYYLNKDGHYKRDCSKLKKDLPVKKNNLIQIVLMWQNDQKVR